MKKSRFVFLGLMLIALFAVLSACEKVPTPNDRMKEYVELWNKQNFDSMYKNYLSTKSKSDYASKDVVDRYKKVYNDLEVKDLHITYKKLSEDQMKKKDSVKIPVTISFNTVAGKVSYKENVSLIKEEKDKKHNWYVNWKPSMLLPNLENGDKISINTIAPKRGEIRDRNGKTLAKNGTLYQVGVVPANISGKEATVKKQLESALGLSEKEIDQQLNASWVQDNQFVPLAKISTKDTNTVQKIKQIDGADIESIEGRVYPYAEATAHVIGYVGTITAEELKNEKGKGYTSNSTIGKRGLEQLYEAKLRGTAGISISIKKSDGSQKNVAKTDVKNGQNVNVTLDAQLQTKIYNQLKNEKGTASAINPVTGEVLALVSAPSFDPNAFVAGMSSSEYQKLANDKAQPLLNRFALAYAPGSSIKPVTAAIALKDGALTMNSTKTIKGKTWQKDKSWGDYSVSRVHIYDQPMNVAKALSLSDNIFFAQTALDLGKEKFITGLKDFGFESDLPFDYPMKRSTISNNGSIDSLGQLADSAYGQGQMQTNILQLAVDYTPFVTSGNLIEPHLLLNEKTSIWKKNIISKTTANNIDSMLRKVVTDSQGTAHAAADLTNVKLAGKTGTAELKKSKSESGQENGLFVTYDQNKKNLLLSMLIEGVQDKGGSGYVVQKGAKVFR